MCHFNRITVTLPRNFVSKCSCIVSNLYSILSFLFLSLFIYFTSKNICTYFCSCAAATTNFSVKVYLILYNEFLYHNYFMEKVITSHIGVKVSMLILQKALQMSVHVAITMWKYIWTLLFSYYNFTQHQAHEHTKLWKRLQSAQSKMLMTQFNPL